MGSVQRSWRHTWFWLLGPAVALLTAGAGLLAPAAFPATLSVSSPLAGTALWINVPPTQLSVQQLAAQATQAGVHTLFVKAADGSTPQAQFSPALVSGLRSAGVSVCAWTFVYGDDPLGEALAAVTAVHDGAQCLIVDAEEQYDKRYGAAHQFVGALRSQLGASFPIGLAGQAEILQHPKFPYSVFLGPGGFDFDLPQMYWLELGLSVDGSYAATIAINSIYGRPLLPVGQLYGSPTVTEVARFRSLAGAYGSPGVSFFDLDEASPEDLASLATSPSRMARRSINPQTLHPGADGDEIVWAQELLNGAGARLPVGGFFGAQTARALGRFQARHHLRVNGLLDARTWRALLRFHPHEPSWAKAPPDSAL